MRPTPLVTALGLILGTAAGCASGIRPEALQAWVGRPAAALEREWGSPTRQVEDGDLRILIYEEVERAPHRDFARPPEGGARSLDKGAATQGLQSYRSPMVYARSYLFWVNREGTIVHSTLRQP